MTLLVLWPERYAVAPTSAPHNFGFSVELAPAVLGVLAGKHIGHDFISLRLALLSHAGCHGMFLNVSVVLLRFLVVPQILDIDIAPHFCGMSDKKTDSLTFVKNNFPESSRGCFWGSMDEA